MRSMLLLLVGLLVGANAVYFWMSGRCAATATMPVPSVATAPDIEPSPIAAPPTLPAATPAAIPVQNPPSPAVPVPPSLAAPGALLIPVQGIAATQLSDTFNEMRGGDTRIHEALDIMAPAGTPVLAAADGKLVKLFTSVPGGLTLYQFDPTSTYAYYYAHLDHYAPGIAEGQMLKRGQVIGYVGSTGNADPAAPHLHFAVFLLGPEKHWWQGTPINPYPLLRTP